MLLQIIFQEEKTEMERQKLLEEFSQHEIGLDDAFHFKCRSCGKCCKNREDIILNPRDLFRIAKYLGMTLDKLVKEYCEYYIGRDSKFPIIRLYPRGVSRACPLLENKRCKVHASKPTVCAVFPIGRVLMFPTEDSEGSPIAEGQIKYILNPTDCGSRKKTNTVRQWLEKFDILVDDVFHVTWSTLMVRVTIAFAKLHPHLEERTLQALQATYGQLLYFDYDITLDFMEQFMHNVAQVEESIGFLQAFYKEEIGGDNSEA